MRSLRHSSVVLRLLLFALSVCFILSCKIKKGTEPPPTPPVPPSNLTALSLSPFAVQLTWTNQDTYDSVLVDRKSLGSWQLLDTLAGTDTLYVDTTCAPTDTNYYRVAGMASSLVSWSLDSVSSITPAVLAPTNLRTTGRTGRTISLKWDDRSTNEEGFQIYWYVAPDWVVMDYAPANADTITVQGLQQLTAYSFRVTAFNEFGESEPSNQVDTTTRMIILPVAPGNVITLALTPVVVEVSWEDRGDCLRMLVSRKSTGPWATIRSLPDGVTFFTDSTAHPGTDYWYRIGALGDEGTAWSADSSEVVTPRFSQRPDSLRFRMEVNTGVFLTWEDRSDNETHFEIERQPRNGQFVRLDSLPVNTTEYADSLRENIGHYFYRIRSLNQYGPSDWLVSEEVDYRYCSDGLIPMCIGNFWQYRLIEGTDTTVMRQDVVEPVTFVNSLDYYLFTETEIPGGLPDSVYYARNISDEGFATVPYPMPSLPEGDVLYQYPAHLNDSYLVNGDTIIVTSEDAELNVNGFLYTGLISYDRFNGQNSYSIWVKPETIGVVAIHKYNREGTVLQSKQELMLYSVSNFTKR